MSQPGGVDPNPAKWKCFVTDSSSPQYLPSNDIQC
jgi:hypothetical protein